MSVALTLGLIELAGDILQGYFEDLEDLELLDGLDDVFEDLGWDDVSEWVDDLRGDRILRGGLVSDIITGFVGDDVLIGFLGNDTLLGRLGDDLLNGGWGSDTLRGMVGDDTLIGHLGRDLLDGSIGDDILIGGEGLDQLWGGRGRDTFVLEVRKGVDTIRDFVDRQDRLELPVGASFRDLRISQENGDTVISFGKTKLAVLEGVQSSKITASDFSNVF